MLLMTNEKAATLALAATVNTKQGCQGQSGSGGRSCAPSQFIEVTIASVTPVFGILCSNKKTLHRPYMEYIYMKKTTKINFQNF